ncbi:hypothetical protein [Bdellovibrio sp. HCB2-146]|uniref:hypothetical protein n=1 Tax=Bdellovibrio sp. HCB2-146 TaxID=3394362 RepID=UPI0039BCECFD
MKSLMFALKKMMSLNCVNFDADLLEKEFCIASYRAQTPQLSVLPFSMNARF